MKKNVQKLLSVFLAVLILSVTVVPVSAIVSPTPSYRTIDFWNSVYRAYLQWKTDNPNSDDSQYPGFRGGGFGSGNVGGGSFSKDEAQAAYNDYVQTLPAPSYTSDGKLHFSPKPTYMHINHKGTSDTPHYYCPHAPNQSTVSSKYPPLNYSFNCASNSIQIDPPSGKTDATFYAIDFYYSGVAPVSGKYKRVVSPSVIGHYSYPGSDKEYSLNFSWSADKAAVSYNSGATISTDYYLGSVESGSCFVQGISPIYEVTPFATVPSDTYNVNTRPTSITGGNYGIVGDNGQITKVEDNSTIVNETNNTFFNPATGTTTPITNWSYDYSDRSYDLTLDGGTTTTVTYGDENITIKEGDTVYNIYYLIEGSGPDTPVDPPASCDHTWTETSSTAPTCTLSGSKLLTCSKCQQTKKEVIPALGHSWQVKQTVTTEYDETGQLVKQGYTIFECSTCHEQYKSTDGTAPPGGGSSTDPGDDKETIWDKLGKLIGTIGSGAIELIDAALGKLLDALITLAEGMMERLRTVVETVLSIFDEIPQIFGGFLDFLTALFPFLPPELMTILTFGILAVVFIGIIKAVRR